jgi:hypothetical protein
MIPPGSRLHRKRQPVATTQNYRPPHTWSITHVH